MGPFCRPDVGLRVVSYNTLAEIYATQGIYPSTPQWALAWPLRWRLVLRQLRVFLADVVCLQEMQADHYHEMVLPAMQAMGYEGVFTAKTRAPMGAGRVDGCATFFRRARLALREVTEIKYNELSEAFVQRMAPAARETALKRLLHDNVAHIVMLELVADRNGSPLVPGELPRTVCVTNTHLFWDPEFKDVKLWQTTALVRQLEDALDRSRAGLLRTPLILCGDLNSEPESAVYEFLAKGVARAIQPHDDPAQVLGDRANGPTVPHRLALHSAYATINDGCEATTNITGPFKGCLDYIFLSRGLVRPVAALRLPTLAEAERMPLCPNEQQPSDHLCVCTDIELDFRASLPMPTERDVHGVGAEAGGAPAALRQGATFTPGPGGPRTPLRLGRPAGLPAAAAGMGLAMAQAGPGMRVPGSAGFGWQGSQAQSQGQTTVTTTASRPLATGLGQGGGWS